MRLLALRAPLAALLLATALAACDRATVDVAGSGTFEVSPDLGVVRLDPDVTLRIVPRRLDGPITVTVDGDEVPFDSSARAFVHRVTLERGLNALSVLATDDVGTVESDVLYAVYLPLLATPPVNANAGVERVDAAAAGLDDGRALITGGFGVMGQPLASATFLRAAGAQIPTQEVSLLNPRGGHTATPLDGGALLLGGARQPNPAGAADFVTGGEWVAPDGSSILVEVDGDVQRMGHTTHALRFEGVTYVYLYGGRVPAGSGTVLSGTVDVFRVAGSGASLELQRLSPPGGSGDFTPVADHVQIRTDRAAVTVFGRAADPVATQFLWTTPGTPTYPFQLVASAATPLRQLRTRAAAVETALGLAVVVGGLDEDGDPLGSLEVYAPSADRTFAVPSSIALQVPRADHVATILSNGRIVVSGGRSASGTALVALEAFQL